MSRLTPLLLALALHACADAAPAATRIVEHFIIVRLYVDPSTRLGEFVRAGPEGALLEGRLAELDCTQDTVLVIEISGDVVGGSAVGRLRLLLASESRRGDLCSGEGAVVIQPVSFRDGGAGAATVEGPLLIEGETLDGRLPLGSIRLMDALEVFPEWWRISARADGLERVVAGETGARMTIMEARAESVWSVRQLATEALTDLDPTADPGLTLLDRTIAGGLQPDVDVDGDGFERFEDTTGDGLVDRCRDGDGDVAAGRACLGDPRFADGYSVRLIFRAEPIRVDD